MANGLNPFDSGDAMQDSDFDSRTNLEEFADGTDPQNADSDGDGMEDGAEIAAERDPLMPDILVTLHTGLNLFSPPVEPSSDLTSADVATQLGPAISSITCVDLDTGTLETTTMENGLPQGTEFPITDGEGYLIEMTQEQEVLWSRLFSSVTPALPVGLNLVGFPAAPPGLKVFLLLQTLGDADTVASIQHFHLDTGRFETATYYNGQPVGNNFPIQRGEAYLISMKQAVDDVNLPEAPGVTITSPSRNAMLDTVSIDVTGTVSDPNTQVMVNGVVASVNGNHFLATGIPLELGVNTLMVVAEDAQGLQGIATIRVLRETP